ncbi:MAG: hypothetical protein EOP45_23145, partial [Sphingobacteriaceae bacterium]
MEFKFESISPDISFYPTDQFVKEIRRFSKLTDGWDFGIGMQIQPYIINRAIHLYYCLKKHYPEFDTECLPLTNGGLKIIFCIGEH